MKSDKEFYQIPKLNLGNGITWLWVQFAKLLRVILVVLGVALILTVIVWFIYVLAVLQTQTYIEHGYGSIPYWHDDFGFVMEDTNQREEGKVGEGEVINRIQQVTGLSGTEVVTIWLFKWLITAIAVILGVIAVLSGIFLILWQIGYIFALLGEYPDTYGFGLLTNGWRKGRYNKVAKRVNKLISKAEFLQEQYGASEKTNFKYLISDARDEMEILSRYDGNDDRKLKNLIISENRLRKRIEELRI